MGWFHSVCVCVVHTVLLEATAVGSGSVVWSLWVRTNSMWELWRAVISTFYWWFHSVCVCVCGTYCSAGVNCSGQWFSGLVTLGQDNSMWEIWRAVISTFYWWFHSVCVWYIPFCWRQLQWAVVQWSGHSGSGPIQYGSLGEPLYQPFTGGFIVCVCVCVCGTHCSAGGNVGALASRYINLLLVVS